MIDICNKHRYINTDVHTIVDSHSFQYALTYLISVKSYKKNFMRRPVTYICIDVDSNRLSLDSNKTDREGKLGL